MNWCAKTILALALAGTTLVRAQTFSIYESYPQYRENKVEALAETAKSEFLEAKAWAEATGSPMIIDTGTSYSELVAIRNGKPVYYKTHNYNAAISTAADKVRNTAPYNLNGGGVNVGVWDAGAVRTTHQEFGSRVSVKDGTSATHYHATHVAGTIGATGVLFSAKGMAPSATIYSYSWSSDEAEMALWAASAPGQTDKLYLSNHSYGQRVGWEWNGSSWVFYGHTEFGQYNGESRQADVIAHDAQYYLQFWSSGNDRNDTGSGSPAGDGVYKSGYDNISHDAIAKNVMTVGAVNDAVSGINRAPGNGTYTSFSSWGPADDGRIKPDIVANGASLNSTDHDSDSDYRVASGTSMSSPNACGSAALLVEYYKELFPPNGAMRASTLKGLIIHTATDRGRAGPDYQYGWGLMDTLAAADLLKSYSEGNLFRLMEDSISTSVNPSDSFAVAASGVEPLKVTLCWTDPPGTSQSGDDVTTPALVNDLDLRITGPGGTYYPFKLDVANPSATATTGDNDVDNVEQIIINTPTPGIYTVTINYEGTSLSGTTQRYSLLMNGISSDSDDDNLPDYWENLYFNSVTDAVASADSDGDGADNMTEYITGHDPTDKNSVFEMTSYDFAETTNDFTIISWPTKQGRLYTVKYSPNIVFTPFVALPSATDLPWTRNSYTDAVERAESSIFYRVDVRLDN